MAAFAWRRRTIAQAIAGAAARVAMGTGTERRELRGLRAVALGPRSVLPLPRVPIVAITGTNGRARRPASSPTSRPSRSAVGMTNSDGIYIRGELVEAGDWTGSAGPVGSSPSRISTSPSSRRPVADPPAWHRLRAQRRLGGHQRQRRPPRAARDRHLDELAEVKGAVVRITRRDGWAVLNAEDPRVWAMRLHGRARPYAFSLSTRAPAVAERWPRVGGHRSSSAADSCSSGRGAAASASSRWTTCQSRSPACPATTWPTPWQRPRPAMPSG